MTIDMSRRQAMLAGAGVAMGASGLLMPRPAHATANPPFLTRPPSPPLNFTAGQTVNVVGKSFSSGGITCTGCANISIQNNDFADGFMINLQGCTGTITMDGNRFRNMGPNGILIQNCTLTGNVAHNAFRGCAHAQDVIAVFNSGGQDGTHLLKIEYNHVDGRDPYTGATVYNSTNGSAYYYGKVTGSTVGNCTWIYNTAFNPGAFAFKVGGGLHTVLYYNIIFGEQFPNSVAAMHLVRDAGFLGGDVDIDVNDIHWQAASGTETLYIDDGSLTTTYLSNVPVAVDLNT